jgi:hypothetical protein
MSASEKTNDESGSRSETVNSEERTRQITDDDPPVPLFLRDSSDGHKGNAQDEKDETGE